MLPNLCTRCGLAISGTKAGPYVAKTLSSHNQGFIRMSNIPSCRFLSTKLPRPEAKREWKLHPMLSIPVVCFSLGIWQINRRKAKLNLIREIESRQNMEPVNFDSREQYPEYTPVRVTGTYDYSHQFFLGPRHDVISNREKGEPGGYHSIVPMVLESGERILVDRGWQPKRSKKPIGQITGTVTQIGYIRHAEAPVLEIFAPPAGSSRTYIWRDSHVMGKISGSLPVTVELLEDYTLKDGPIAGQTRLTLYNKHAEYIVTWFGLGIVSLFFILNIKRSSKHANRLFKS